MMSAITYQVYIDHDDDGNFNTSEDIAYAITEALWRIGTPAPHATIATTGTARLHIDGTRLSLTQASAWLGRRIRISATYEALSHTLFTGWIHQLERKAGDLVSDDWVLIALDAWGLLGDESVRLPMQQGQRTGALIQQVLAGIMARPVVMKHRWLIEREGHSRLDAIRLADERLPMALDEGQTRLTMAGITWGAGAPVMQALRQIADAERGRIIADREGRITFYDRHRLYQMPVAFTLNDDAQALRLTWGRDNIASVEITCQPQRPGTQTIALWCADQPIRLAPQSETRLVLPYHDAMRQACGAVEVQTPQAGIHYQVNGRADGTGADQTHRITSTWQTRLSAGVWRLLNPLPYPVYLQMGAKVWGVPLMPGDALMVRHGDDARRALYAGQTLRLDLPAVSDSAFAHDIARYEWARRHPQGIRAQNLVLSAQHRPDALALDLFARLHLMMTSPTHTDDYLICAVEHHITQGGADHRITWMLEPANPARFWLMGASRLNDDASLAL